MIFKHLKRSTTDVLWLFERATNTTVRIDIITLIV